MQCNMLYVICYVLYYHILYYERSEESGLPKGQQDAHGRYSHTCHNLPPSEIDLGLCLAVFAGSEGRYLFHRIGRKGRIWQLRLGKCQMGSALMGSLQMSCSDRGTFGVLPLA